MQFYLRLLDFFVRQRFGILLIAHALVFVATYCFSFALRFDFSIPEDGFRLLIQSLSWIVGIKIACFYAFKSFHGWWRYVAFSDLHALAKASFISVIALALVDHFFLPFQIPRSVLIVDSLLTFVVLGSIRSSWRLLHEEIRPRLSKEVRKKTLLVGSGDAVVRLGHQLRSMPHLGYEVIGIVSPGDSDKRGWISSFPILGNLDSLELIFTCYHVEEVLALAGELTGAQMRTLKDHVGEKSRKLRVIPRVEDLFQGDQKIPVRDVEINDLLGRKPVVLDNTSISTMVRNQVVLVTGAGGSIGSEICRQLVGFGPKKILILGRGENRIFEIERELRKDLQGIELVPIIADIYDLQRLRSVFEAHKPNIVFHAAAHKHVPLMEANVSEAIKNNILGTKNVADCAHEFGVSRFVLISTDKAVNPTSVMGASKHMAERYTLSRTNESTTRFVVVRFGNVLGSNGSVVPIFQEQIRAGGPITITDPRMKRFFMSIPEASQLVLQAAAQGQGGEIFVLDMGEPVLIVDLARDLIRLSGLAPDDIEIHFSGIRPGEKLYEELYFDEETSLTTAHPKIFAAYHRPFPHVEVQGIVESFARAIESDVSKESILEILGEAIPEFNHSSLNNKVNQSDRQPSVA